MARHPLRALGLLSAVTLIVLAFVLWEPLLGWSAWLPLLAVYIDYRRHPTSETDRIQEAPLGPGHSGGGVGGAL
jgi:hypothetical protein